MEEKKYIIHKAIISRSEDFDVLFKLFDRGYIPVSTFTIRDTVVYHILKKVKNNES